MFSIVLVALSVYIIASTQVIPFLLPLHKVYWCGELHYIFFVFAFVLLLSFLRAHSFFSSAPQPAMISDF